ncbi:MAG: HNH endonuclease signature motif containing protein [Mycobacterium sp.]
MFDTRLHEYFKPSDTDASRALLGRVRDSGRAEAQAAAARLDAIAELFELRRIECGERADWAVDTWAAVGAEVAAVLRISLGMAGSYLHYARAMWERLPKTAALFRTGDIDYRMFQTLVFRTGAIEDPGVLVRVDAELAIAALRWPSLTRGRLAAAIDAIVGAADPDAVRHPRQRAQGRELSIWGEQDGITEVFGRLFATDAALLDQRLDALAATVCDADPRTRDQRRADAMGALAAGAQRLGCQCATPECGAASAPAKPVVIHVVAEQSALSGHGRATIVGGDGLIPAELVVELAKSARLAPVVPPAETEAHYVASKKLAEFVRARDLTCRAPGCDRPATHCDVDHTIPYADGGATHPSNLKCLCRLHHLLKTFWGWRDKQLPDGTVIWDLPGGQTYVTTPGSALLFPALCTPTGTLPLGPPPQGRCTYREAMMPLRATTRAHNRARYIADERRHNHQARQALQTSPATTQLTPPSRPPDDEPPPF